MFVAWPVSDARAVDAHRREARGRVVVRDQEQRRGDGEADQRAQVDVAPRRAAAAPARSSIIQLVIGQEGQRRQHAGHDQALVERPLDVARRAS